MWHDCIYGPIQIAIWGDPDPETGEAERLGEVDGYHLNITRAAYDARPELTPYRVTPTALRHVWSGDDPASPTLTVALRFDDADQARAALADLWTPAEGEV